MQQLMKMRKPLQLTRQQEASLHDVVAHQSSAAACMRVFMGVCIVWDRTTGSTHEPSPRKVGRVD